MREILKQKTILKHFKNNLFNIPYEDIVKIHKEVELITHCFSPIHNGKSKTNIINSIQKCLFRNNKFSNKYNYNLGKLVLSKMLSISGATCSFTTNGPISKIIKKFIKGNWSHVGNVYDIENNKVLIAEATAQGYIINKYTIHSLYSKFLKHHFAVGIPFEEIFDIEKNIKKYENKPYGFINLLLIAIKLTFKKSFSGDGEKTLICSESSAKVLYDSSCKKINLAKEVNLDYDYITPYETYKTKYIDYISVK